MINKKSRFEFFSFYDHTGMEMHLEKMAAKGWLLERVTSFRWIYHRIEPRKLAFKISYYPKASEFDPQPSQEQQIFHDFCAHTGWLPACTFDQMQVFYNENEHPLPIETDPLLELETIHRTVKQKYLPAYFILLFCAWIQVFLLMMRISNDPIGLLSSDSTLVSGFAWIMLAFMCMTELGGYFHWRSIARKAAEHGEFLKTSHALRIIHRLICFAVLLDLVYWLTSFFITGSGLMRWIGMITIFYTILLYLLANGIKQFLKRRNTEKNINRNITLLSCVIFSFLLMLIVTLCIVPVISRSSYKNSLWTAYDSNRPLTLEDLLDLDGLHYTCEYSGDDSLLLGQLSLRQYPQTEKNGGSSMPQMNYTVTVVKQPFLYRYCQKKLLHEQNLSSAKKPEKPHSCAAWEKQDASLWGAKEVYLLPDDPTGAGNTYLLCYDDRLVDISFSWELTPAQMGIVGRKLGKP